MDEMRNSVGKKRKNGYGSFFEIYSGMTVGLHTRNLAPNNSKKLWKSIPGVYRQCAVCYSDFWKAYEKVIPDENRKGLSVRKRDGRTVLKDSSADSVSVFHGR